jgi:hypothetical protein
MDRDSPQCLSPLPGVERIPDSQQHGVEAKIMGDFGNRRDCGAVGDNAGKPRLAENPQISPQALLVGQDRRSLSREVTG